MVVQIKPNTIFVSIASYRDSVCSTTVESLYSMADSPQNVYVGLCQQNNGKEDQDCVNYNSNIISKYIKNIRTIRIPYFEAKGPTWARYLCSTLWDGEQYYFQIDSHTKFVKGWDTKCINMINMIKDSNYLGSISFKLPQMSNHSYILECSNLPYMTYGILQGKNILILSSILGGFQIKKLPEM